LEDEEICEGTAGKAEKESYKGFIPGLKTLRLYG
jgi:hypothetical protein